MLNTIASDGGQTLAGGTYAKKNRILTGQERSFPLLEDSVVCQCRLMGTASAKRHIHVLLGTTDHGTVLGFVERDPVASAYSHGHSSMLGLLLVPRSGSRADR